MGSTRSISFVSGARREDALQRNAEVQRQIGLHVLVGQAAAGHRGRLRVHERLRAGGAEIVAGVAGLLSATARRHRELVAAGGYHRSGGAETTEGMRVERNFGLEKGRGFRSRLLTNEVWAQGGTLALAGCSFALKVRQPEGGFAVAAVVRPQEGEQRSILGY